MRKKRERLVNRKISKDPVEVREVACELAAGFKPKEVAKIHEVAESSIYRLMSREEVQALIEQESQKLVAIIPKAVKNVTRLVQDFDRTERLEIGKDKEGNPRFAEVPVLDSDSRKLAWDATKKVLEAPGLLSGGAPSVQIGKIVMNNQTNIVSPMVLEALKQLNRAPVEEDGEVIEAEVE